MLRCEDFQPFQVWAFPFEFPGDPDRVWKSWIVARNFPELNRVAFFKPSSQTKYYDREPTRLCGVVEYAAGEIGFFPERTLIDPKHFAVEYAYLRSCHVNQELRMIGCLPEEFRDRMNCAALKKEEWRERDRQNFRNWFK